MEPLPDLDDLERLRTDYARASLNAADLGDDPISALVAWYDEAVHAKADEPNAMTLATVDERGQPSARIVLCRGIDERGLRFFTNYDGRKGVEIERNSRVALLFFWRPLERQVRVEGRAARTSDDESDAYFATRPRESRLGAWASPQSETLTNRAALEASFEEARERFDGVEDVPRPSNWGGYLVVPKRIEFWQGRPSRLHDRIVFERDGDGWAKARLAP